MWKRYLSPTPANVARLLIGIKTVLGTIAGAEMIAGNAKMAFYIMLAIGIVNEGANFLTSKRDEK
jgi:hypothetical protein